MTAVGQQVSLPISDKVFLFKQKKNDCSLFLYGEGTEVYGALLSFIESGLENDELCIFAYDNTEDQLHPENVLGKYVEAGKLYLLPMEKGGILRGIKELNSKVWELCRRVRSQEGKGIRVGIDFGSLPTRSTFDTIIDCVRGILEKRGEKIPLAWGRRRYKQRNVKSSLPLRMITAFNVNFLRDDAVGRLLEFHENVVVSTRNEHRMSIFNYRSSELPSLLSTETIPRKALERLVKKHLEVITLSLLLRNPMCGYDLIRTIYRKYHTFLSQGTVYPLLYDLKRRELLDMKSGNLRSKVYTLTEEGKRVAEDKINDFISAQKYLLDSIRK